ncbi:MAG: hypothetical protein JWM59_1397 [Verrucomicrobiales bacterium]|nr:hypothetical protein [Verrucomicrobiales bacterium]
MHGFSLARNCPSVWHGQAPMGPAAAQLQSLSGQHSNRSALFILFFTSELFISTTPFLFPRFEPIKIFELPD